MLVIKFVSTLFTLALVATSVSSAATDIDPLEGYEPFFIHRTIPGGFAADTHNGFYCYAVENAGIPGEFVVAIVVVKNNEVAEFISHGSSSGDLLPRIRNIGLKSFDFKQEVEDTINRKQTEHATRGEHFSYPMTLDGSNYRITYSLDGTDLEIEYANPGHLIAALAEHSEDIGKLHAVYKELMVYYAERKLNFK